MLSIGKSTIKCNGVQRFHKSFKVLHLFWGVDTLNLNKIKTP